MVSRRCMATGAAAVALPAQATSRMSAAVARYSGRGSAARPLLLAGSFFIVLLVLVQAILEPSLNNVVSSVLVAFSTVVTFAYCGQTRMLHRFPLSTLSIVGFNVTTHSLALVAQTLYGRALVYNLQWPLQTFRLTIILQLVLLGSHFVYTNASTVNNVSQVLARRVLRPLWCFRVPTVAELWLMGGLGTIAIWIAQVLFAREIEYGDVGGKLLLSLTPYQVAPAFILFRKAFMKADVPVSRSSYTLLAIYFGSVLLSALALNSRGAFSAILFDILIALALAVAIDRIRINQRARTFGLVALLLAVPLISLAQDLSTAMIVVRNERGGLTTGQLIAATAQAFGDKDALARQNAAEQTTSGTFYSEYYISSPFLQRLTYTKYTDIQVNASRRFGDTQLQAIKDDFKSQLMSSLPTPLLKVIGSDIDKNDLYYSNGDLYDQLAFGAGTGGFKTGSAIVNSRDVLGAWWIPGMIGIFMLTFIVSDSFSLATRRGIILSPLSFILLYTTFTHVTIAESLRVIVDQCLRGFIQTIFLYVLVTLLVRSALALIRMESPTAPRASDEA